MTIPTSVVVGIDPGLTGGIAVRVNTGSVVTWNLFHMPVEATGSKHPNLDIEGFISIFADLEKEFGKRPDFIVVEQPPYIPTNGGFATRSLFKAYGEIRGVLITSGHAPYEVQPKKWQAAIFGKLPKLLNKRQSSAQKKAASIKYAQSVLPKNSPLPYKGPKTKKYHDGLADAVCLADLGRRLLDTIWGAANTVDEAVEEVSKNAAAANK